MYPITISWKEFVTDFREKAEFFLFFAKLCSLRNSDSPLPSEAIQKVDNSLYSVGFSVDDKSELTNNLDSNKGRG